MRERIIERIIERKIIAIVRGLEPSACLAAARALHEGGIELIEVTFNQSKPQDFGRTAEAVQAIAKHFGGRVLAGAGTVTSPRLVEMAAEAGAGYIVSPDTNPRVIEKTRELGLVSLPGAMTPTEILTAHEAGADFVKLFPAASLGIPYARDILSPINHVRLIATGGVDAAILPEYLRLGFAGAGVGGRLCERKVAEEGNFAELARRARALMDVVEQSRGG